MFQSFNHIVIESLSSCVPEGVVKNDFFTGLLSDKELRMFEKTVGIIERRWAEKEVTASDLGYHAANKLFENGRVKKEDIKCVIFLSQTSDFKIPFTSNILQSRLGLGNDILCLDLNAGCAGFVQGLSTAYSICNSMESGKVLFIVSETLSKILSPKDRSTSMLFGDAASALIISKNTSIQSKSYFNFFSDGSNSEAIQIPHGGYRNMANEKSLNLVEKENGNFRSDLNLQMDGPKVFDFTLREVALSIENLLGHYAIEKKNIDYFMFHQSNKFIIQQIASKLGVSMDKAPLNIQYFGNTSGVSLPLLLTSSKPLLKTKDHKILFSGYGSGLNWGCCVLNLDEDALVEDILTYE